jgi:hypothetical protein
MPSSDDSIPEDGPAAVPPIIDPEHFEDFEGFRETTLCVFTDPKANGVLRGLGDLLYTISLEYARYWPAEPEGSFYHQARAAVADIRHLQGFLAHMQQQREETDLSPHEIRVAIVCGSLVPDLRAAADALEGVLGPMGTE